MPLAPTFLPLLVEQIFEKYERLRLFDEKQNPNVTNKSTDLQKQFFIELDAVFGEVLKRALQLLDEQTITVITDSSHLREIAEITEGHGTHKRIVRLFPGINYCPCKYFLSAVLKLEVATCSTAPPVVDSCSYTCEHVLALRLGALLRPPSFRSETLLKEKFKLLFSKIQMTDSFC